MSDSTIRVAILALSAVGGLAVVCIGILIAVLRTPDVAALAVLASIASAAVGGVAGTINSSRTQPPDQARVDGRPRQEQRQEEQRRGVEQSGSSPGS
jgi:hypothetical protein